MSQVRVTLCLAPVITFPRHPSSSCASPVSHAAPYSLSHPIPHLLSHSGLHFMAPFPPTLAS
ncbi:hypothetical protein BT69DRAFT_1275625 [Atractiella rhizophila]|nr:hypothetical protein BT69DRAFT_1275625 [Atractiella rhizophila]